LIGLGVLMVCLATPAALVSAQAPAPAADGGSDQAVAPEEPVEAPAPQPQPPDAPPPSAGTPAPNATPSPAPTTPGEATEGTPPAPLPVADSSTSVSAAGSASVSILDGSSQSAFRFSPSSITVGTGDSVAWTNNGSEPHDVTGSGLGSGTLQPGQGYSHTFVSPGTFSYICSIHPFMEGSVTVQAADSSGRGGSDPGSTQTPPAATAPGSESAAVTSPGAAGTAAQLPSTGMPVLPLLAAGVGLLLAGALLRRGARVS
jgi:plastocyanin